MLYEDIDVALVMVLYKNGVAKDAIANDLLIPIERVEEIIFNY